MERKFWLKLSGILLASVLFLSFSLSWFFSVYQSRHLNYQTQLYLSEYFSFIYNHVEVYLKKKKEPSFVQLQKIFSRYSVNKLDQSRVGEEASVSKKTFVNNMAEKSVFLINNTGIVLAHSESNYKGKNLPQSSPFLSLIRRYSKGWNLIVEQDVNPSLITVARSITISSTKYFIVVSQPAQNPNTLFLSYFRWILLFSFLSFLFLFLIVFLYLKSFTYAAQFLFRLFGKSYRIEQKKALSYLAHTDNFYLRSNRSVLISVLRAIQKKEKKEICKLELSFSDIVHKAIFQSNQFYPDLHIYKELNSDISLPVFADQLFQSLWELIKNVVQVLPTGQAGELIIRTFKKSNTWFCCEVEDKGPGMDRTTMEKATQLYFTTKKNSTGLGLPFVQSILSRMGGIVKLQSSENGGLKVCLFIPLDYIVHIESLKKSSQAGEIHIEDNCI